MIAAAVDYNIGLAKHKAAGTELKNLYRLCYARGGKVRRPDTIKRVVVAVWPDMLMRVQKLEVKAHLRKFTGYADVRKCSPGRPFGSGSL